MLQTLQATPLMFAMVVLGPLLLAAGLIYGIVQASKRRKSGLTDHQRNQATRELYRQEDAQRVRDNLP